MSSALPFTQQNITLPEQISGILTSPQSAVLSPGILLLHGFLSQKDEVGGFYRKLAISLANRGMTSLRIDFHGCGESSGDVQDITVRQQVQDAQNAFQWLAESGHCNPSRMGMVGFSLGAAVATIVAARHPGDIKSLVLLSPLANMHHDLQEKYGRDVFIRATQMGIAEIDTGWTSHYLKAAFFNSLDDYDLLVCIKNYKGALLTLAGDQDYSASNATILAAASPAKPKEALILTGADHVFGVLGEDSSIAVAVIELASRWLIETV